MAERIYNFEREECINYHDHETNEVRSSVVKKAFTKRVKEDEFYMAFFGLIGNNQLTGKEMTVMSILCGKAEHDKGYIDMTLKMKEIILEELEMTSTHFNNITSKLAKKGFISKDKGRYHINPKYFWKGSLKARREKINDELELSIKFKIED